MFAEEVEEAMKRAPGVEDAIIVGVPDATWGKKVVALVRTPGTWVYAPVALAGAAYAGLQTLPLAMLPDVVSVDAESAGPGHAGTFGGVWTAGETAGMALGTTLLTVVLAVTGYRASLGDATAVQPPGALTGIVLAFSVVPAGLLVLSLVALRRYPLRRAEVDAALGRARRQETIGG